MLPFIRPDLAQLVAYTPHPGGDSGSPVQAQQIDRLDANENPYDLPDELKQKLAWAYHQAIAANRYPDGAYVDLKGAIAQYVAESAGLEQSLSPDWISVGNGSDELIRSLLIATCIGGAGSILAADPTFGMYRILAQTLGVPVVSVERDAETFAINLAAAERAIAQDQTIRMVCVVHPNSPTGNALTVAEIEWLRSLPSEILVLVDEAYFEFSQSTLLADLLVRPNWVILRTFSKAFRLASHRVGYSIAHPELTAALEKVRLPYNLPATTQAAAMVALGDRQDLLAVVPLLLRERDALQAALSALPQLQVYPSAANFLFVRLAKSQDSSQVEAIFQQLKAQGTLIRQINGGFRVSVGTPEENGRTVSHFRHCLEQMQ
jgi:histidinol-phosphate aminotransferase